jgi:DNA repair exonuclease SbcCD nuclease subunit
MAKWLLIGDPHAVVDELDDMRALIEGIKATIRAEKPDNVLFMGDQFHNHAIIHVEVMAFWREAFRSIAGLGADVYALVGNHDMPGDASSRANAMMACEGTGVRVVDNLTRVDGCLLIPYRHTAQDFLNDLASAPLQQVVFCHQTFDGSKYENGMYAPDGISLAGFEDRQFISGHIHTAQRFSNVMYIGAPRWRSLSDVGVERALFLVDVVDGKLGSGKTFDTAQWCQKLLRVEDRQETPLELQVNPRWKYIVDIHGDENFIKARKAVWAGCRVRTFKTQSNTRAVSESMGIHKAIQVFMDTYVPKYGTDVEALRTMVNQRLGSS